MLGIGSTVIASCELPADHDNFERQQNNYGHESYPGGQSVAPKEV